DALDVGADAKMVGSEAGSHQEGPGYDEQGDYLPGTARWRYGLVSPHSAFGHPLLEGEGSMEPAAGDQAENHRPERGKEAERGVAAAVVREGLLAREQVEKPGVEGPGEVAVLVPVSHQAGVMLWPIRRDADFLIVKITRRQRIESKGAPVADENHD